MCGGWCGCSCCFHYQTNTRYMLVIVIPALGRSCQTLTARVVAAISMRIDLTNYYCVPSPYSIVTTDFGVVEGGTLKDTDVKSSYTQSRKNGDK